MKQPSPIDNTKAMTAFKCPTETGYETACQAHGDFELLECKIPKGKNNFFMCGLECPKEYPHLRDATCGDGYC